ncbi:hypothetical protein ABPG74_011799 [Tetrahymena malaccensis]
MLLQNQIEANAQEPEDYSLVSEIEFNYVEKSIGPFGAENLGKEISKYFNLKSLIIYLEIQGYSIYTVLSLNQLGDDGVINVANGVSVLKEIMSQLKPLYNWSNSQQNALNLDIQNCLFREMGMLQDSQTKIFIKNQQNNQNIQL